MSKKNNVNPNFYKDGGRAHTEGPDKGDSSSEPKQAVANQKKLGKEGPPSGRSGKNK